MVEKSQETENVGEILRNARLKNGKTLSDVSKDLCIRKVYLEAIENMDFEVLPSVPYGVGFVRSYAEYLGLDKERVTAMYKQASHPETETEKEKESTKRSGRDTVGNNPDFTHILIGFLGLAVAIAVWKGYEVYQNRIATEKEMVDSAVVPEPLLIEEAETEPAKLEEMGITDVPVLEEDEAKVHEDESGQQTSENKNEENAPVTESPAQNEQKLTEEDVKIPLKKQEMLKVESEQTAADSSNKIIKETPVAAGEPAQEQMTPTTVRLVLVGPSWVEVRHGNNILINGNYGKGFSYDIPDEEGMVVSVGRYRNVEFYVNGRLTKIASAMKQTNIKLNQYIKKN